MATREEHAQDNAERRRLVGEHLDAALINRAVAPDQSRYAAANLLACVGESLPHLRNRGLLQRDTDVQAVADWMTARADAFAQDVLASTSDDDRTLDDEIRAVALHCTGRAI